MTETPAFPGAIGLTELRVYDWEAEDGLRGGSPHVHLASTECYIVTGGSGRVETLRHGGVEDVELAAGTVAWFEPGTVHRAINGSGDLRVVVAMANRGLPEAGDAVLTFPPEVLADPEAYVAAVSLAGPDGRPSEERARARRDLAVRGYRELRAALERGDTAPYDAFLEAAARLARLRAGSWPGIVAEGPVALAAATRERVEALAAGGGAPWLAEARVARRDPAEDVTFGMCGRLRPYGGPGLRTTVGD